MESPQVAPTAIAPTSAPMPATGNAETADKAAHTDIDIKHLVASLKMQMARRYLNDLREYFDGDEARFSRMVVDGGKSLPTAHPHGWAQHCMNMLAYEHIPTYFAEEARAIREQLIVWELLT